MAKPSLLRVGWSRAKEYLPAILAAAAIFGGLHQLISILKYPLIGSVLGIINYVIAHGFRDRMPLPNNYDIRGIPWQYHARNVATALVVILGGFLLGLWANARNKRRSALLP